MQCGFGDGRFRRRDAGAQMRAISAEAVRESAERRLNWEGEEEIRVPGGRRKRKRLGF